jgi:hypothetical protein
MSSICIGDQIMREADAAAGMEERHHAEVDVRAADADAARVQRAVGDDSSLFQHRALGEAGAAGGVLDHAEIAAAHRALHVVGQRLSGLVVGAECLQ